MPVDPSEGLAVSDLGCSAGGKQLLRGVSFSLRAGQSLALTGPSGIGKTTLLRALAGLFPATGVLTLGGRTPAQIGYPSFRRQVVYTAQRPALLDATVRRNLQRPFEYRHNPESFPEARALTLLDRVGLGPERMDQAARSLSVGQQQRVCLVRSLLVGPLFLLLDEPTSALDPDALSQAETLLSDAVAEGVGIILVTHQSDQADRLGATSLDVGQWAAV